MYKKVNTDLNFAEREKEIMRFWKDERIFERSIQSRENAEVYTFYDGPPTANGKPHVGHLITRAVKDLFPRYKTMKGFKVLRKAGWDTHGLPVELEVEKSLNISGKPEIEKFGVEPFIAKCKESVWKYEKEWRELSDRVAFWADMENPYVTYHNNYIESVWWALKRIWDEGLLYKGHKIVPYCPRCGTSLSSHEVAQGYKDVKETSVFVKFKIKAKDNEYFLAWTTTPWTLPSNVALTVNAKENYARVNFNGEVFILAEALVKDIFKEGYEILESFKGSALEYTEYEPLFDFVTTDKKAWFITCDAYVTLTDGSGIVHSAPAFGEDDARVGKAYGLPFVQLVDEQGKFTEAVTDWAGVFVKDADPLIVKKLNSDGKLFRKLEFEHSYPFCWRCDTPLLYYARDTWFIEMTKVKSRLLENNDKINWMPSNIKNGRFGNFLENVIDWGLSRERYWGTPLPIWECVCGHRHAVGSIAELKEHGIDVPDDIELHKPFIDRVFLHCEKCGKEMKRVSEVIDCWFDSGSMPFAQWHYPFENKELFEENFPADFISEALDQTRGWFYTLLAISTILFDKSPYDNCIVLGLVADKDGKKMSKHLGNGVDPWEIIGKVGADAVRWYFYVGSSPWLPSRFYEEAVSEACRKFMGTLWNTYAFYVLYADIDSFNPKEHTLDTDKLCVMDRWVLSKLNSLVAYMNEAMDEYKLTECARELNDFVDELSNWYVRRSRERFWASGMEKDKTDAYMTLYTVLETVIRLAAPFTPFMTESIYENLVRTNDKEAPISVHLCDYPAVDEKLIDSELEKNMKLALNIVVLGRAARNVCNIKNRQPIGTMFVNAPFEIEKSYESIITDELNVKNISFTNDTQGYVSYSFKPQLKTLGKKYGKLIPKITETLRNVNGREFMATLKNGAASFVIDGEQVELALEDVLVEETQTEGFVSQSDRGVTVVMDTTLTPELIEEGYVREIVSKIQTMRKEADFEVMDEITVTVETDNELSSIISANLEEIKAEVLALELKFEGAQGLVKQWNINGKDAVISVKR